MTSFKESNLVIRSVDRSSTLSTSSADCAIKLSEPFDISKFSYVELLYFQLYNTCYNITSSNNQIDLYEDATDKLVTLTTGSYNASTLATELQTQLNTASGGYNTFTVSYSTITRKFTFSASNNFQFKFNTGTHTSSSPWKILGFSNNGLTSVDSSTSTTISSPSPSNFATPQSYFIRCKELGEHYVSTSGDKFTFYVPSSSGAGAVQEVFTRNTFCQKLKLNKSSYASLTELHILIETGNYTTAQLNNSDWELLLRFSDY